MKIGLIGYGKMNRLIEKACKHPIRSITKDFVRDFSADLYIDFSHASCVERNALLLASHGKCHLIGTTGWESKKVPQAFQERGAALFCPNFSKEIARFVTACMDLKRELGPPDLAQEWHHKSKKDRPSGTAKRLEELLGITFTSERVDETIFKHQVRWGEIVLTHEARDRSAYVAGALEACEWLYGRKGWYDDFFGYLHTSDHSLQG